jgi:hypothetical protein
MSEETQNDQQQAETLSEEERKHYETLKAAAEGAPAEEVEPVKVTLHCQECFWQTLAGKCVHPKSKVYGQPVHTPCNLFATWD